MNLVQLKESLNRVYSLIPDFECKHCHSCCGPIIWFEPEDFIIKDYFKKNNISLKKNEDKCPFLGYDGCKIYPVRPIVCRLQGLTKELPCKHTKKIYLSDKDLKKIKNEFNKILALTNGYKYFYSSRNFLQ